jgi:A/G-specific adenine glycosylase
MRNGALASGERGRGRTLLKKSPLDERAIATVRRRLLHWGRANFKQYPWRSETDPWLSFLAEFLLQRTRASQVEPVYVALRERFPTAASLAAGGLVAISELTQKLGLHRRGPLLLRIAEAVAARGGTPPETIEELRTFTGVGMYTTAAWLSLHRGRRAPIIDANVARWLSRMTGLPYNRDPRHVRWVQDLADGLTPRRAFRAFNYAVLDFTMNICTPRNPLCATCPLQTECLFGSTRSSATTSS